MNVLLLAAGQSRRAKPISDKNGLRFAGKTLLEHHLDSLTKVGFKKIFVVGGAHNLKELAEWAKDFPIEILEQSDLTDGMAGGISAAEGHLKEGPLLIVNGGDFVDPLAYKLIKTQVKAEADLALLAYEVQDYFPGGYLELDSKDFQRIISIVEKPEPGSEPSSLVNLVVHFHRDPKRLFEALREAQSSKDDRYEVALDLLMKQSYAQALPYRSYFYPIKYPWHVLPLCEHFLNQLSPSIDASAQISETAKINGPVVIAEGVKVFDYAIIQGPAYIGKNTIIGNHALVRQSSIGERCVVGYHTEVARSLVGDDTWFHSNYVGDSVIGNNCSFGAGAICANLRLDEAEIGGTQRTKLGAMLGDHIRIGVNTSLMPGIKVGSHSMIGSGLTIAEDIPEKSFVTAKTELTIKENRFSPELILRKAPTPLPKAEGQKE